MTIYIVVAIFFLIQSVIEERIHLSILVQRRSYSIKDLCATVNLGVLVTLSVLRTLSVGNDLASYENWYSSYRSVDIKAAATGHLWEFGYYIINRICIITGIDYHGFVCVHSILCCLLFYFIIKNLSRNYSMSFFFFMTIGHLQFMFSTLRLELAILLVGVSTILLIKKKYTLFVFTSLFALTVHTAAIVGIVIYAAVIFRKNRYYMIISFAYMLAIGILSLTGLQVFFNWYSSFRGTTAYSRTGSFGGMLFLFLIVINIISYAVLYIFTSQGRRDNKAKLFLRVVVLGNILQLLTMYDGIITRMVAFFTFFYIILLPNMIEENKNKVIGIGMKWGVAALWFVFFVVALNNDYQGIVPYISIFT